MDTVKPTTLAEQGKQEYEQENYLAAADLFSHAAQAYTLMKDELNAAEMKNNQSVALLQAGKAKEALQATDGMPGTPSTARCPRPVPGSNSACAPSPRSIRGSAATRAGPSRD